MSRKEFEELTLKSDYLFGAVLGDKNVAKLFLENLLEVKIKKITVIENQTIFNKSYKNKSIRLDVYVESDDDVVYDIEMQQGESDDIRKRMRFYQGKMDADYLKTGSKNKYETLRKTYIIFICDFDLIGEGQCCYKFENTCTLDNKKIVKLEDDAYKILLYTKGVGGINNEIQEFLHYIENSSEQYDENSTGELVKATHQRVNEVKNSKEMEGIIMNLEEKIQIERVKERKKTLYENIQLMLKLNIPESEILKNSEGKITSEDIEYVKSTQSKKH